MSNPLKISYNGNDFLLDVAEGKMVSLNSIYEIAGSPVNKEPYEWKRSTNTKELVETLAKNLHTEKLRIIKTSRARADRGGGTWAHWQLALAYAKYLSPDFHLVVNEVFKERLEEEIDPELGINRARERARKQYLQRGKTDDWVKQRFEGIEKRNYFTDTLKEHGVNGIGYAMCTDAIYKPLIGGTAKQIKEKKNLPKKANLRDTLTEVELSAINFAETLAKDKIRKENAQGNKECAKESSKASASVAIALEDHRKS